MNKRKVISFSVNTDKHNEIIEYVKEKGHGSPSNLARLALFRYITQYPIVCKNGGTSQTAKGNIPGGQ